MALSICCCFVALNVWFPEPETFEATWLGVPQGTVYKVEPAFTLYVWLTLTGDLAVL